MTHPRLTVFTAAVYPDSARLWLACVLRAFPADDARIEIFDDSDDGVLAEADLPRATVLTPAPSRRDFLEAYNDALARVSTPYLVFLDTDVFWVSRDLWSRVLREIEPPRIAAVSCAAREAAVSPGTFAVVMKVDVYRDALGSFSDGFFPFAEREAPGDPPGRWIGHDTGDLATRRILEAGFDVRFLNVPDQIVRFTAITNIRRIGGWVGPEILAGMAARNPYFSAGTLGNWALRSLYGRVFPGLSPYGFDLPKSFLCRRLLPHPRASYRAVRDSLSFRSKVRKIERFLREPGPDGV